jgi:DeoR/GlpR family transcriptional regulator of sugar metabolism
MGKVRAPRGDRAAIERRRQDVLDTVIAQGEMRIDDLTDRFGVSLMTMHRDLDDLAARRLLRKLRGRVAPYPALTMETAKRFRLELRREHKEALSAAAAEEVGHGQTVIIDDSTTLFPLARGLAAREPSTVITHSLEIARTVSAAADTEVILLGGRYTEFDSCVGPDTVAALREVRADTAFLSATAVAGGRFYHPVREYAEVKTALLGAARRGVLVADHSKFGRTATYAHGDAADYDLVITDDETPDEEIEAIRALGTRVRAVGISRSACDNEMRSGHDG